MAISPPSDDQPYPTTHVRDDAERVASARHRSFGRANGEPWWGTASVRELVGQCLIAAGVAALAGAVLGLLWQAIAPTVTGVVTSAGVVIDEAQSVRAFGGEGMFAALTAVGGVVAAVAGRRWVRSAGPVAVVSIAMTALLGAVVAWRVGVWAGPNALAEIGSPAVGSTIAMPLVLHSHGLLFFAPIAATFVTMWIAVVTLDTSDQPAADDGHDGSAPPGAGPSAIPGAPGVPGASSRSSVQP